ncbi:MAG: hypothetical protein ACYTBX_00620 [Planctomycetota bacterium]
MALRGNVRVLVEYQHHGIARSPTGLVDYFRDNSGEIRGPVF